MINRPPNPILQGPQLVGSPPSLATIIEASMLVRMLCSPPNRANIGMIEHYGQFGTTCIETTVLFRYTHYTSYTHYTISWMYA